MLSAKEAWGPWEPPGAYLLGGPPPRPSLGGGVTVKSSIFMLIWEFGALWKGLCRSWSQISVTGSCREGRGVLLPPAQSLDY